MTKISSSGPSAASVPRIPSLSSDVTREELIRAIRHLTTALGKRPAPAMLDQAWGRTLYLATQRLNITIPEALKAALHGLKYDLTQVDAGYLRTVWKGLIQRLGHQPTAFEIDNDPGLPPALAFKQAGLLKEQTAAKSAPAAPTNGRRHGTLAENSSFKPRECPLAPPTADYGRTGYVRPPTRDELRTAEVMAQPLPKTVWDGASWRGVPRDFDDSQADDPDMFAGQEMSRPEPLIRPADMMTLPPLTRPADVMPVPQLERPAAAPKVEIAVPGFHILRPDEIDATKLLPSDTIPVITHSHDDCVEDVSAVATVAAMVMGVIAFFYGGAALMRAPLGNPAFGSGGVFVAPRSSRYPEGA